MKKNLYNGRKWGEAKIFLIWRLGYKGRWKVKKAKNMGEWTEGGKIWKRLRGEIVIKIQYFFEKSKEKNEGEASASW